MHRLTASTATAPFREAFVDLDVVRTTTRAVERRLRPFSLIADLGADAFGHGAAACAAAVVEGGASAILVSSLPEALAVRAAGVVAPIACPLREDDDLAAAISADLIVVVRTPAELAAARGRAPVALVIDTGLGMPALLPEELPQSLPDPVWVLAELDASGEGTAELDQALRRLAATGIDVGEVIATGPPPEGRDRPASVTAWRVGAEIFALTEGSTPTEFAPAMTLWAPVVAVKRVGAGEGVSYGHTYVTTGPTTLALVSLGYGDGLDRGAGNVAPVWVADRRFTITGRMAMDAHVIDVGPEARVSVGDPAVLFGDPSEGHPRVSDWADALGVSSAEITTRLTDRVRRTHR